MAVGRQKRAVLIAGPTASGKSALALARARETGGVVINTDAMQVYDVLRVLTARPPEDEMRAAPHLLYGTVSPTDRYSTGDWIRAVVRLLEENGDRELVFAGGTGLYFEALTRGLAAVPEVPAEVTRAVEAEVALLDGRARARLIADRDPEMAVRLQTADPQRVVRALAVQAATGRSLASFQDEPGASLLDGYEVDRIVLNPDRELLGQRIARRFSSMLASGAVEEVQALLALELDRSLPAMKAIGVREIGALLRGEVSEREAVERAVIATRQYAKRQRTWFRSHMTDWTWRE